MRKATWLKVAATAAFVVALIANLVPTLSDGPIRNVALITGVAFVIASFATSGTPRNK